MKKLKYILLFNLLLIFSGCIRENLEKCWNVELSFRYLVTEKEEVKDLFAEKIQKVDLFVFDRQEKMVESFSFDQTEFSEAMTAPRFRLRPGDYHIIAVGNGFENTEICGSENGDLTEMYLQHPLTSKEGDIRTYDKNYIGAISFSMGAIPLLRDTINMEPSHMSLKIEITGVQTDSYPEMVRNLNDPPYYLEIDKINAKINLSNQIVPDTFEKCIPQLIYDSEKGIIQTQNLALFKFDEICEHVILLFNREKELQASVKLNDFITEYAGLLDITRPEIEIPIEFKFSELGISVQVPDWLIVDVDPIL